MGGAAFSHLPRVAGSKSGIDGLWHGDEKSRDCRGGVRLCALLSVLCIRPIHAWSGRPVAGMDRGTDLLDLSLAATTDYLWLFAGALASGWRFGLGLCWRGLVLLFRETFSEFKPPPVD